MPDLPESFRAYVVDKPEDGAFMRGLRSLTAADLPPGEVTIRVEWSGVNFKDGLARARGRPRCPGLPADPRHRPGRHRGRLGRRRVPGRDAQVLAHGYDIGIARHGGYGELARIPSRLGRPAPDGLTARDAMAIGTAGFTAAMSVEALEERGLRPGDGPVLVTGASGGVGSTAVAILASRGHEVWAATGKADEADASATLVRRGSSPATRSPLPVAPGLRALGGRRGHGRRGDAALRAPDPPARGRRGLVRQRERRGLVDHGLPVHPARRALLGMDSANMAIGPRRALWDRLATDLAPRGMGDGITEVDLDTLEPRSTRSWRATRAAAGWFGSRPSCARPQRRGHYPE